MSIFASVQLRRHSSPSSSFSHRCTSASLIIVIVVNRQCPSPIVFIVPTVHRHRCSLTSLFFLSVGVHHQYSSRVFLPAVTYRRVRPSPPLFNVVFVNVVDVHLIDVHHRRLSSPSLPIAAVAHSCHRSRPTRETERLCRSFPEWLTRLATHPVIIRSKPIC